MGLQATQASRTQGAQQPPSLPPECSARGRAAGLGCGHGQGPDRQEEEGALMHGPPRPDESPRGSPAGDRRQFPRAGPGGLSVLEHRWHAAPGTCRAFWKAADLRGVTLA